MAGPGGKEAGRLRVKVVPDTDGFRRELEELLAEYSKRKIEIRLDVDTAAAEEKLKKLTRDREVKLRVNVDLAGVEEKIKSVTRERKAKIDVEADVRAASEAIEQAARKRQAVIEVAADTAQAEAQVESITRDREAKIQANAQTAAANARIDRAARTREAQIQIHLVGEEAVRRLNELTRDRIQRVKVLVDEENARTRLRAIGKDNKLIAELEVDQTNIREVDRWLRSLGPRFAAASDELIRGLHRAGQLRLVRNVDELRQRVDDLQGRLRDRDVNVSIRVRGTRSIERLRELERRRVAHVEVQLDDKNARARLRVFNQRQKVIAEVDVDEDNLKAVKKWIGSLGADFKRAGQELQEGFKRAREHQRKLAQDRSLERRYQEAIRQLERGLTRLGSTLPQRLRIEVDLDYRRRLALLSRELRRLEREAGINIRVDLEDRSIASRLAELTRRRRVQVEPELRGLSRFLSRFGKGMQKAGSIGLAVLSGVIRGLGSSTRLMGRFGDVSEDSFRQLSRSASSSAQRARSAASAVAAIVSALVSMGTVVGILTTIVTIIGAIIVSAISAVAALASVVIGAAALLALPAAFAALTVALMRMGNEQDRFRQRISQLASTVKQAVGQAAQPMLELFADTLAKANEALKRGAPLYGQLQLAFAQATEALRPLTRGLDELGTSVLARVNSALKSLNSSGVFDSMANSIRALGIAVADVFVTLSKYGPAFAQGFDALVRGLDRMAQSLSHFMGAFTARGGVEVVNSFADGISRLLDVFARNAGVYTQAASSLARAVELAAPGFERLTAVLAKISPGIFFSLGSAIERLGNAASDPRIASGLEAASRGLINLATAAASLSIKATAQMGNFLQSFTDGWAIVRGKIRREADITRAEFQDILSKQDTFNDKVGVGLQQLRFSVDKHFGYVTDKLVVIGDRITQSMQFAEGKVKQSTLNMYHAMRGLVQQWKDSGGQVTDEWRETWAKVSETVDKSGNQLLIQYRDAFNALLVDSERFRNKLRQNLIDALKAEGVPINDTILNAIDQQLGLLANSADQRSQEAINAIQQNFNQLPMIVRRAMDEARTPEELRTRLQAIEQVIGQESGAIARAFARLPQDMQRTLTESTAAFQTWTGMQVFKQRVAEGVSAAVNEFQRINATLAGLTPQILQLGYAFGTAGTEINVFGNRAAGAANGVRALASASNQTLSTVRSIGTAASSASRGLLGLSGRVTAITNELNRAGGSADSARARIASVGSAASVAVGGFNNFSSGVNRSMASAERRVSSGVRNMEQALSRCRSGAGKHGNLSNFVSSVSNSMSRAYSTVSSYVSSMLSQLRRLNTTVTTTHRIQRVVTGPSPSEVVPNFTPNSFGTFSAMVGQAATLAAAAAASEFSTMAAADPYRTMAGSADLSWGRAAASAVSESRKETEKPAKVYNITVTAAPNVPTERQIVDQLRYADILYP